MDAARSNVDEEQHIDLDPAAQGPHWLGEEVAGPQGRGVALEEVVPTVLATIGPRVQPRLLEDVLHCRAADLAYPQLLQLAKDAGVAPASLRAIFSTSVRMSSGVRGRPGRRGLARRR